MNVPLTITETDTGRKKDRTLVTLYADYRVIGSTYPLRY